MFGMRQTLSWTTLLNNIKIKKVTKRFFSINNNNNNNNNIIPGTIAATAAIAAVTALVPPSSPSSSTPTNPFGFKVVIHEDSLSNNIKIIGYYTAKTLSEKRYLEELQKKGENLELDSRDLDLVFSLNEEIELEDLYLEVKDLINKLSIKSEKGFVVLEDIILEKDEIFKKFFPLLKIEDALNKWLNSTYVKTSVQTRATPNPLFNKKALFEYKKDGESTGELDKDKYDPLASTALKFDTETYKWINNLIYLNLYNILWKKLIKELDKEKEEEENGVDELDKIKNSDFLSDYKCLVEDVYRKIDPSIKDHLGKKGLSVVQNIYTGFDTEYYMFEDPIALSRKNILLSAQLSVNTKTYLKIPKRVKYVAGGLNSLTNDAFITPRSSSFNYRLFERNVNDCINEIRDIRFKINDNKIEKIIHNLRKFVIEKAGKDPEKTYTSVCASDKTKFSYYEEDGLFVFGFPRSIINNYVYINDGKGFSFNELVLKGKEMGNSYLIRDYELIKSLLKKIDELVDSESNLKDNESNIKYDNNNNDNVIDSTIYDKHEMVNTINLDAEATDCDLTKKLVNKKERLIIDKGQDLEKIVSLSDKENNNNNNKKRGFTRSKIRGDLNISITKIKNMYILAHNSQADLSMLSDYNELKENLDIVNKSYVTRGKPLFMHGLNIHIRDTMLLAPAGYKSLEALGDICGLKKVDINDEEKSTMQILLKKDPVKFINYAYKDSMITLTYACKVEDSTFESRRLGIPLSLSSLASIYLRDEWVKLGYKGYQLSQDYLIGDSSATLTPKGLVVTGDIGLKLSYYIASYKGGRNESYMYGIDRDIDGNRTWSDYDLTSAYPTGMAILAHPDYWSAKNLTVDELNSMNDFELVHNYIVMKVKFEFPIDTKYPSIPVNVNENLTCYPLTGESVITGIEYSLAKRQGCKFIEINDIFMIPFTREEKEGEVSIGFRPFFDVVKELKFRRSLHKKKTFGNLLEKEKVNSIYGLTVKGINNKKLFDIRLGSTVRMEPNDISNPIIASWITAFVRSVLGECMHNISKMNGLIVSATTDGFITNIIDLEKKLNLLSEKENYLFKLFKESGSELVGKACPCLELKVTTKANGLISWSTRGQFSEDGSIKAATGIQTRKVSVEDLNALFKTAMSSNSKTIEYVQKSLTSAKDSYLFGSQVFMNLADRRFRMSFDHKRLLVPTPDVSTVVDGLIDSKPLLCSQMAKDLRFVDKFSRTTVYNKFTTKSNNTKYKNNLDFVIRNFIRGWLLFHDELNLPKYKSYNEIIKFIKDHQPDFKISKSSIANLKTRPLGIVHRKIDDNNELIKDFLNYVVEKHSDFNREKFLSGKWMYEK